MSMKIIFIDIYEILLGNFRGLTVCAVGWLAIVNAPFQSGPRLGRDGEKTPTLRWNRHAQPGVD